MTEQMIERSKVRALLKKALHDQRIKHEQEITALHQRIAELEASTGHSTDHNNVPGAKREQAWQTKYVTVRDGVAARELPTLGRNAIHNYLRKNGHEGCNGDTAAKIQAELFAQRLIDKHGRRYRYFDEVKAA